MYPVVATITTRKNDSAIMILRPFIVNFLKFDSVNESKQPDSQTAC